MAKVGITGGRVGGAVATAPGIGRGAKGAPKGFAPGGPERGSFGAAPSFKVTSKEGFGSAANKMRIDGFGRPVDTSSPKDALAKPGAQSPVRSERIYAPESAFGKGNNEAVKAEKALKLNHFAPVSNDVTEGNGDSQKPTTVEQVQRLREQSAEQALQILTNNLSRGQTAEKPAEDAKKTVTIDWTYKPSPKQAVSEHEQTAQKAWEPAARTETQQVPKAPATDTGKNADPGKRAEDSQSVQHAQEIHDIPPVSPNEIVTEIVAEVEKHAAWETSAEIIREELRQLDHEQRNQEHVAPVANSSEYNQEAQVVEPILKESVTRVQHERPEQDSKPAVEKPKTSGQEFGDQLKILEAKRDEKRKHTESQVAQAEEVIARKDPDISVRFPSWGIRVIQAGEVKRKLQTKEVVDKPAALSASSLPRQTSVKLTSGNVVVATRKNVDARVGGHRYSVWFDWDDKKKRKQANVIEETESSTQKSPAVQETDQSAPVIEDKNAVSQTSAQLKFSAEGMSEQVTITREGVVFDAQEAAIRKVFADTRPVAAADQLIQLQREADGNAHILLGMATDIYGNGEKIIYTDHIPTRKARQIAFKNAVVNAEPDADGKILGSAVVQLVDDDDKSLVSPLAVMEGINDGGLGKLLNEVAEREAQSPSEMEHTIGGLEKKIVPVSLGEDSPQAKRATNQDASLVRTKERKKKGLEA